MTTPDDPLIARVRAHDRNALVEFLESRKPQLLAFISRSLSDRLRGKVELVDIYQEASLSAIKSFDEVDLSQRDPFNWLCHLAERRIIDAHRRFFGAQKRSGQREVHFDQVVTDSQAGGFAHLLIASITTPSKAFSRNHRELRLREAFDQLPEESRRAVQLRYVEGLPTKQIAEALGKSDGAVRVLLTRAIARLREIMTDEP
jgi:RNA polymerase sigma-70 factor (ECF subfamily)